LLFRCTLPGVGYDALADTVRNLPQDKPKAELTVKDMLRLEAYAATLGWLDEIEGVMGALKGTGFERARDAARAEIKRIREDYPTEAFIALGIGGVAGGLAVASGGAMLGSAARGGGILGGGPGATGGGLLSGGSAFLEGATPAVLDNHNLMGLISFANTIYCSSRK